MSNEERAARAQKRLTEVRAGILQVAGTGDQAISQLVPNQLENYRQLLRQRLAAARGRTYTYRDPKNIYGGPGDRKTINIVMPDLGNTSGGSGGLERGGSNGGGPYYLHTPPPTRGVGLSRGSFGTNEISNDDYLGGAFLKEKEGVIDKLRGILKR